jgi:hypothetical protein
MDDDLPGWARDSSAPSTTNQEPILSEVAGNDECGGGGPELEEDGEEPLPEWLAGSNSNDSGGRLPGEEEPPPRHQPQWSQSSSQQPQHVEGQQQHKADPEQGGVGFSTQPAWFSSAFTVGGGVGGGGSSGAELLIPDGKGGAINKRVAEPEGSCRGTLQRVFCSFKTALVPALVLTGFLSLLNFILRFVLRCKWKNLALYASAGSLAEFFFAFALAYTLLRGEGGWLCSGFLFAAVFAGFSAIILICEWLSFDECKGVDGGGGGSSEDNGARVPPEIIPAVDTLLALLWSLCAYLFRRGSVARREEKEGQRGAARGAHSRL